MIKKSKVGSLRDIARRDGGLRRDGKVSKAWARSKLTKGGTRETTKKKIRFFLNFNK